MKTYTITKSDLDSENYYIGQEDVTDFSGHIRIEADLGTVRFKTSLRASGEIVALTGTGIEAGGSIKAGEGIKSGWSIEAGEGIEAGCGIEAGGSIEAGCGIKSGGSIEAGCGIKSGGSIEAGGSIKAGDCIEAGEGILAHLGLECKEILSFNYGLHVGVCTWRETTPEERQAICGKLEADPALVKFGEVVETGLPEEVETIEVLGVKYNADELRERLAELKPMNEKGQRSDG